MDVQPAKLEQVRQAADGRMVLISADVSSVAADLRSIDPGLKVRFAENGNPPFWAVYHESTTAGGTTQHLVLTQQAHQNRFGVWEGLDERVVRRIREIDPRGRSGYDFAREVERQNERAQQEKRKRFSETVGEHGELAAHAVRKDLGARYKGRAFTTTRERV